MSRYLLSTIAHLITGAIETLKAARQLVYHLIEEKPRACPVAVVTLRIRGDRNAAGDKMTVLKDTDGGAVYSVELKDAKGFAVPADGVQSIAWATSTPDVVLLQTPWGGDPLSAHIEPAGVGTTQVSFSCDADLGEGVTPLAVTDDVQVLPGAAVSAGFRITIDPPPAP